MAGQGGAGLSRLTCDFGTTGVILSFQRVELKRETAYFHHFRRAGCLGKDSHNDIHIMQMRT